MSRSTEILRIIVRGVTDQAQRALNALKEQGRRTGRSLSDAFRVADRGVQRIQRSIVSLRGVLTALGVGLLFRQVIRNTTEQERALTQLEARLRSTGGAAGLSRDELVSMAEAMEKVTTFSQANTIAAQNVLLTYTQIGRETFPRATEAVLDWATAVGVDARTAAETVGRALGYPSRALDALSRQGFRFTEQQTEQIRLFEETGRMAEAQAIILEELEESYGGSARAARQDFGGALEGLKNAFGNLLTGSGGNVPEAREQIEALTDKLSDPNVIAAFENITNFILRMAGAAASVATKFIEISQGLGIFFARAATGISDFNDEIGTLEDTIRQTEFALERARQAEQQAGGWTARQRERARDLAREEREEIEQRLAVQRQLLELARRGQRTGSAGTLVGAGTTTAPAAGGTAPVVTIDQRAALRDLQAQLEAAGVLLQDELRRLQGRLDQDFAENLTRFRDYYNQRAELERRALDQQIEAQQTALRLMDEEIRIARERDGVTEDSQRQRARLVAEITVLERQRADVTVRAAREQAEAERRLAEQLDEVRTRLKALQGDAIGAQTDRLAREFSDLMQRLATEGDAEGQALVERLINVELARTQLDQLEADYQRTLADLERAERRVQIQVDTGLLSEREGRRRIIDLHRETAAEVQQLIPLMEELAEAIGDPATVERLKDLQVQVEELAASANTAAREIRDAGTDAFASWLANTRSAGDAFDGFVQRLRQRAAEALADRGIQALINMLGGGAGAGGGGGAGGAAAQVLASIFHGGGVAGGSAPRRALPAAAFIGAPRFHSGGKALGLSSDEVPAILKRGERVLNVDETRQFDRRGESITVNQTVVTPSPTAFRQSDNQIAASTASAMLRARARNR